MKRCLNAILVAVVLCGCDAERKDSSVTGQTDDSPVFVAVGDRRITVNSVSNSVMILAKLRECASRKTLNAKMFPYWANATAMKSIPALLAAERFDLMLVSNGVKRTVTSDAEVLKRYNRTLREQYVSADDLIASFGPLAPIFEHQFSRESRSESFFGSDPKFKVTERNYHYYYRTHSNAVQSAENYNRDAYRRATNICARLKAGDAWENVAQASTEEGKDEDDVVAKDYWKYWDTLSAKHPSEPAVVDAVARLKPGEWTTPIEISEGLVIVCYLGEDAGTRGMKCARILLQLAFPPRELNHEEIHQYLLKRRRDGFQYSIREDLVNDYPAVFPMGTNFTYKIWFEPKKLKKGFNSL